MNEAMKQEHWQPYFAEMGITAADNVLYAQIDAKAWEYIVTPITAAFSIQHFLLCFTADEIILAGVTVMGGLAGQSASLPRADIQSITYKAGLLQGKLTIVCHDAKYVFKVPQVVLVAPWQKVNLSILRQRAFNAS